MGIFSSKKENIVSLHLNEQEEASGEKSSDSTYARAEQMELFADNRPAAEIGRERIAKAADAGKKTLSKIGGFFKSAWASGKSGLETAASYAAAPDVVAAEIGKKIDGQVEHFSDMSGNVQEAASEKMDDVGAGANAFIDRMKDSLLAKYAEKIGLREGVKVPKIASPEARTSILGLDDAEKSMGGELIVGSTIFDRVKEFGKQIKSIRAQYETQKQAAVTRRAEGEVWLREKEAKKVTGRKVAEGVSMQRAEDKGRSHVMRQLEMAQSGNLLRFDSFNQAMQFAERAKQFGVDIDMGRVKLQIGRREEEDLEEAA
jgi:hypothetical protein